MTALIDIVVLTGFLGSGKTTLLRDFLTGPDASDTAVIVNEAGEIGLDGVILQEAGSSVPMTLLANGCVCCEAGNDLLYTIDALLEARTLRRIILETSGLSRPGPVLRQLAGLAGRAVRVTVLATFDAGRGTAVAQFAEAAAQWAAANRIVATKLDTVPARLAEARAEIAVINPLAEIVATPARDEAIRAAFAPLDDRSPMPELRDHAGPDVHPQIAVRLARPNGVPSYDELAEWLDNLAGALGDRLLRLKGLLRVQGSPRPLLVQSVGTMFSALRPFGAADSPGPWFLVVIAQDLRDGELDGVMPAGLFHISAWSPPGAFARRRPKLQAQSVSGLGSGAPKKSGEPRFA